MQEDIRRAMLPSNDEIRALPLRSHTDVVAELLGTSRQNILDVGCGDGKFTRLLATIGKSVSGIDVKEARVTRALDLARAAGMTIDYRVASGEKLPYADGSFDTVVFSNSLHHIPNPATAIREALRVLSPGGLIYVMEPVPAGTYQEAIKPVNDETEVRTEAYRALQGAQATRAAEVMFRARRHFADFEEWKADQIDVDEKRRTLFEVNPDAIRRNWESHADRENGKLAFDQVYRVNLLKKP